MSGQSGPIIRGDSSAGVDTKTSLCYKGETERTMEQNYTDFLASKAQLRGYHGFDPVWMPDFLYDFQSLLVEWAVRKGRCAVFANTGLGKTPIQLVWAENVVRKTGGRVLILTPLAVARQTSREAEKFGIEALVSRDGGLPCNIVITNYERLHYFNPGDFVGVVCDESSALKNFDGVRRAAITEFMRRHPYRLLATATAAPNDYIELGTSSEALGELGFVDMLSKFFKKAEKTYTRRDEHRGDAWRFRGHAEQHFWSWVCSWARSIRTPSDMGCDDGPFILPPLTINEHIIEASRPRDGFLFEVPAVGLREQREERRRTLAERCEKAASLVNDTGEPAICWCHLNDEGDILERIIPDSAQVAGADSDDKKTDTIEAFIDGKIRVLVTKSRIAGWGLNLQHCAHQTFFPSHSWESWYQSVRRSWRFGQTKEVVVDVIASNGDAEVMANMNRKQDAADKMFEQLVALMFDSMEIQTEPYGGTKGKAPSWM